MAARQQQPQQAYHISSRQDWQQQGWQVACSRYSPQPATPCTAHAFSCIVARAGAMAGGASATAGLHHVSQQAAD